MFWATIVWEKLFEVLEGESSQYWFIFLFLLQKSQHGRRPPRGWARRSARRRALVVLRPRRDPHLSPSLGAAHGSRTNTKESGGFASYSSHHNDSIFLPASNCPPSLKCVHVALQCGTSGQLLVCFPAGCRDKLVACLFSVLSTIQIAAAGMKIELSDSSACVVLRQGELSHSNSWFF